MDTPTHPPSFNRTVTDEGGALPAAPKPRPWLYVLDGPDRGRHLEIGEAPRSLGRGPVADIVLLDERVSRVHCAVGMSPEGRVEVVDRGSRNGTYVNGVRVDRGQLLPDSLLQIGQTILQVQYKDAAQVRLEEEAFRAAVTDPLTGIPNRRGFSERAPALVAASTRHGFPLSAVFADLDHFKGVNDAYGHKAGDLVLREAARRLSATRRTEDLLCRYGGEEFLALLPYTGLDQAVTFAERARRAIAVVPVEESGLILPVTASFGVAAFQPEDTLEALVERADRALYRAKTNGRNRVEKSGDGPR